MSFTSCKRPDSVYLDCVVSGAGSQFSSLRFDDLCSAR